MVLEPTTKCMLGIECEWNRELVDWKGNGNNKWKGLIPQHQNT
jgi:hypothetical protein